jgi:myosin heavy subunit
MPSKPLPPGRKPSAKSRKTAFIAEEDLASPIANWSKEKAAAAAASARREQQAADAEAAAAVREQVRAAAAAAAEEEAAEVAREEEAARAEEQAREKERLAELARLKEETKRQAEAIAAKEKELALQKEREEEVARMQEESKRQVEALAAKERELKAQKDHEAEVTRLQEKAKRQAEALAEAERRLAAQQEEAKLKAEAEVARKAEEKARMEREKESTRLSQEAEVARLKEESARQAEALAAKERELEEQKQKSLREETLRLQAEAAAQAEALAAKDRELQERREAELEARRAMQENNSSKRQDFLNSLDDFSSDLQEKLRVSGESGESMGDESLVQDLQRQSAQFQQQEPPVPRNAPPPVPKVPVPANDEQTSTIEAKGEEDDDAQAFLQQAESQLFRSRPTGSLGTSESTSAAEPASTQTASRKKASLFGDDDDDDKVAGDRKAKKSSLFGDDESDDDVNTPRTAPAAKSSIQTSDRALESSASSPLATLEEDVSPSPASSAASAMSNFADCEELSMPTRIGRGKGETKSSSGWKGVATTRGSGSMPAAMPGALKPPTTGPKPTEDERLNKVVPFKTPPAEDSETISRLLTEEERSLLSQEERKAWRAKYDDLNSHRSDFPGAVTYAYGGILSWSMYTVTDSMDENGKPYTEYLMRMQVCLPCATRICL